MPSTDPERALAARLVKGRLYAERVASLARERGFAVIEVDGSRAPEAICSQVEEEFADLLRRRQPTDLAVVRTWENENAARNLRAWVASGDLRASAEMAFPFACECGRLGCGTRVELTLSELDQVKPILAHGHDPVEA